MRLQERGEVVRRDLRLTPATLVVGCILLATACLFSQDSSVPLDEVTRESLRFADVFSKVEQNYLGGIDADHTILDGAVRGMLSSLDPFSAFFDRDQFQMLQEQTRGQTLGFGSILYVQVGKVVILQTAEGSPAARAGLGPGDEIVEVNGTRLNGLDFSSLIQLLQRSRSQRVHLGVIHPGRLVAQDFVLNPAEVALPTVDKAFLWAPGIVYVHLTSFEQKTPQELMDALSRLGGSGLKGVLLDLRDNHGGLVDAALGVSSLFLKPDLLVLTVRGRREPQKSYHTQAGPARFDAPLILLVNENTASAAEVVASALQEHDRALVVGEPTYGKGVVESVMPLSERTGLALTTAQYVTASGRSIQRPLPGTALASVEFGAAPQSSTQPAAFHTDRGRPVTAGGGVTPDVAVPGRALDPWLAFLDQRGLFTSFASDYLTLHGKVERSFQPDSGALQQFREFLDRQRIRVPEEYWPADQDYLKLRIKTEVITLTQGLETGDEIGVRSDPQVERAAALFPRLASLLAPSPPKRAAR